MHRPRKDDGGREQGPGREVGARASGRRSPPARDGQSGQEGGRAQSEGEVTQTRELIEGGAVKAKAGFR